MENDGLARQALDKHEGCSARGKVGRNRPFCFAQDLKEGTKIGFNQRHFFVDR
jgi:hypothetical protein